MVRHVHHPLIDQLLDTYAVTILINRDQIEVERHVGPRVVIFHGLDQLWGWVINFHDHEPAPKIMNTNESQNKRL